MPRSPFCNMEHKEEKKMECERCCYYGQPEGAPETEEERCMYSPEENEDEDYTPPCFRENEE